MALYSTYEKVGKIEDVSSEISMISPASTPFLSEAKTRKVNNELFSWQEDSLTAAVGTNAAIEGATFSEGTQTPTVLRSGYTQVLTKVIKLSRTTIKTKAYGRANELAYQLAKEGKAIKRDLETSMIGIAQAAVAGSSSTARRLTAFSNQVASANIIATGGVSTAPTEAKLLTALQTCYENGSEPSVILVTPTDSLVVAGFTASSGRTREITMGGKTLVNAVDLYVSPFGECAVKISRNLKSTDTLVYDPEMIQVAVLDPWQVEDLAKTSDAEMKALVGEYGLIHKNQAASAVIRKQA